ncbi:DnaA regulatory inactivator Hda [Ketobacter sp.]|uniref:DnaA regulatory inactivator Hda n=1 Tax=Ketobacter sp. TaxID=2083498 RepID=UPI0025BC16D9|nr:DnaA regulatory inactivator Hda [Ketobacter sp.]
MAEPFHPQLALRFYRRPNTDFASYYSGQNQQLVERLQQVSTGALGGWVYLWGSHESGKSHLLQAAAQRAEDSGYSAFYLAGEQATSLSPQLLENLSSFQLLAIDDLHLLVAQPGWAEALFHLYNRLKDLGAALLVSADAPPRQLSVPLQDLQSRLMAMEVYQVLGLDDEDKAGLLELMARQRNFSLSEDVIAYILSRSDRTLGALQAVVERLDLQSLQEKRVITIPFVKKVMSW